MKIYSYRSGFKNLDEIKEVLHHHENDNGSEMNIVGLWTHFGYADEFDVPEYGIEREAWLNVVNTLLNEGYHLNLSMRKIVRVIIVKDNNFFPIIHARVVSLYMVQDHIAN